MDQLLRALENLKAAEQTLDRAVAAERSMGKSWQNIGDRLGVTRQAAFKRFGKVTDALTGEILAPRNTDHLNQLTENFFWHVARGEEELAMGMIHPSVRKELPWPTIADTWKRCLTECGELESISGTFITHPGGTEASDDLNSVGENKMLGIAVGAATLNQEAGETMGRVAFDQDDAVVGILYLPADTPAESLPF